MASATGSKFQAFMNHTAGPKTGAYPSTVHQRSPSRIQTPHTDTTLSLPFSSHRNSLLLGTPHEMVSRRRRPERPLSTADKISVPQNVALAATGMIWVRYSLVITPVNYSLAAVNFFVGCSGLAQLYRVWDFRRQHPVQASIADKKNEAENKLVKESLPMSSK